MRRLFLLFLAVGLCSNFLRAATDDSEQIVRSLKFKQGEITLGDNLAKLNLPADFRYLDPADAATVLTKLWGNPPKREPTLGMIVPSPDLNQSQWAVVLEYDKSGYVSDADADKIDYSDLLKKMKQETLDQNKDRQAQGYPPVELVGWAATPRYDRVAKKLYWAKDFQVGGPATPHSLNYNIRMLGRRGYLLLNVIGGTDQLAEIQSATPQLLAMVDFKQGSRYADFDPKTDKIAAFGLAALVAGGIAAKAGLFKVLWIGILAFKKFIIIGALAISGWLKRFFGNRRSDPPNTALPPPV